MGVNVKLKTLSVMFLKDCFKSISTIENRRFFYFKLMMSHAKPQTN